VKEKLLEFYKSEAKDYIESRLKYISRKNNLDYNNFKITSAKTRWGSCSSKRNLSFTFRLIMTKTECIDYVIIHELAHLKEMNHSKNFWNEVEIMSKNIGLENYKVWRKWLKEKGENMRYI
jgi:predicted metal-dependent hydrolase